jgi:hypothetical protein
MNPSGECEFSLYAVKVILLKALELAGVRKTLKRASKNT